MIQLNPRYEVIFDPENIDQDCDRIAGLMKSFRANAMRSMAIQAILKDN